MLHDDVVWLLGMATVVMFLAITEAVRKGYPWRAAIASFVTSPLSVLLIATLWERRSLGHLLNLGHQSVAFYLGDSVLLPVFFGLSTLVWRCLPPNSRWRAPWYRWLSLVPGAAIALWFHASESRVYVALRLNSPSKLTHDYLAEPTLAAAIVFCLLVVLYVLVRIWREMRPIERFYAVAAVAVFIGFAYLLLFGQNGLNPAYLHPLWDWNHGGHIVACRP